MNALESLLKIASSSVPVKTTRNGGKGNGIAFVNKSGIASVVVVVLVCHAIAFTHSFPSLHYRHQYSKYY